MKIGNKNISGKVLTLSITTIVLLAIAAWALPFVASGASENDMLYIYPNTPNDALADSLEARLGKTGARVATILKVAGTDATKRVGAYKIDKGESPLDIARTIRNGHQTPIKFTFNNIRLKEDFAKHVSDKFLMSQDDMLRVLCDSAICAKYGKTPETISAAIFPDSYEFYWNIKPEKMLDELASYSKKFWNADRQAKAAALGLTPDEVVTVASITEEETAKRDERGKIGRLYINRVQGGIPLQADPTVKYAIGDFSIRRITHAMTAVDNPYNTYRYAGLPPGPIRFVEKVTIDAVLNSEPNDYIYMCAKEDFSGYHNFASSYSEHLANAARYHNELNRRGIK